MTRSPVPVPLGYVWDASALHHFSKAGRVDVLGTFVAGPTTFPWRHYVTDVVAGELGKYGLDSPSWCEVVGLVELADVLEFANWSTLLSDGVHDQGEASVVAYANRRKLTAIVDDGDARRVAQRNGCDVHGSAWLLCQSINAGCLDAISASSLLDAAIDDGARYPFRKHGFRAWAEAGRLLRMS